MGSDVFSTENGPLTLLNGCTSIDVHQWSNSSEFMVSLNSLFVDGSICQPLIMLSDDELRSVVLSEPRILPVVVNNRISLLTEGFIDDLICEDSDIVVYLPPQMQSVVHWSLAEPTEQNYSKIPPHLLNDKSFWKTLLEYSTTYRRYLLVPEHFKDYSMTLSLVSNSMTPISVNGIRGDWITDEILGHITSKAVINHDLSYQQHRDGVTFALDRKLFRKLHLRHKFESFEHDLPKLFEQCVDMLDVPHERDHHEVMYYLRNFSESEVSSHIGKDEKRMEVFRLAFGTEAALRLSPSRGLRAKWVAEDFGL